MTLGKSLKFDAKWQRRRRWRRTWRRWKWLPLLVLLMAAGWWINRSGWADGEWTPVAQQFPVCGSGERGSGCVIDGDTIAIGERRIRLTGYDAPELDGACEAERAKAREARSELSAWLSAAPFALEGGAEQPRDRYGRELRAARRDRDLLSDYMLAQGLGRADGWGWSQAAEWCEG